MLHVGRDVPERLKVFGLDEDIYQRTVELLLRKKPGAFDPTRGDAKT